MVSTRGVKFKFCEGEKVLCYEPDPTKAKVLYDSKVLELNVSRDNRGRKVPEYLIHFYGWSSSWDRCVKEEFILPDTEENRNLQIKLAQNASSCLPLLFRKGRRKGKFSPIVRDTVCKKEAATASTAATAATTTTTTAEETKDPPVVVKNEVAESSGSESSDEDAEKLVEIEIPPPLKENLEDDWYYITQKDKVIKLPCEHDVVSLLEDYVKHLANELIISQNKKMKNGREFNFQVAEAKIHFCKEVMDGIRVYFDFTLPHLLLYRQEKKQFYTVGNTCVPVCRVRSDPPKKSQKITDVASPVNIAAAQKDQAKGSPVAVVSQTVTRGGLRNQAFNQKSPPPQKEEEMNGVSHCKGTSRSLTDKEPTNVVKKPRPLGSRQGLRSRDKQKSADDSGTALLGTSCSSSGPEKTEADTVPARPESPTNATSPSRQTRRSLQNVAQAQASPVSTAQLNKSPQAQKRVVAAMASAPSNVPAAANLHSAPLTVSVSNTNSSTHANLASPKVEKSQPLPPQPPPPPPPPTIQPQLCDSRLLKEVLLWRMLPPYLYDQIPAAPSLIYGVQHLLRLFVKLPELIYKTNMPQKKLGPLLDTLEDFLQYLSSRKEELFLSSSYIDSCEDSLETNSLASS